VAEHDIAIRPDDPAYPGSRTPFAARTDLAPHTHYHLEGRGDFYTDATGKVTYVETTYGGNGNLNADLNRPQEGVTYVVHPDTSHGASHVFEIGPDGRTELVVTDHLDYGDADRSRSVQSRVGNEAGDGYDGGHALANMFGGGGEYVNLVAMLKEVNRAGGGSFYALETHWRSLLDEIPPVDVAVRITPEYSGPGTVPESISDEWSEKGVWTERVFEYVPE
jgi:hypothetical protein